MVLRIIIGINNTSLYQLPKIVFSLRIEIRHASRAMMLLYACDPHSRVMYNEMALKAANSSLKVCWEPPDDVLLGFCGTQTVRACKLWFNY